MKPLHIVIAVIFCLTACNHKPANPEVETTVSDTTYANGERAFQFDTLILDEYVVYSTQHIFSDSLTQDSFVVELPAGNVMHSYWYLRVFNSKAELIYTDSLGAETFARESDLSQEVIDHAGVLAAVKRRLFGLTDIKNYSVSGSEDAIKGAPAYSIENMIAFNEAVDNPSTILYRYDDGYTATYIMYSKKLQKVVVVVKEEYGEV